MKHAGSDTLDLLEDLLLALREHAWLAEKSRGVFYRRGRAFLHFHEDPAGIFADIRPGAAWERLPVGSGQERRDLLDLVASAAPSPETRRG